MAYINADSSIEGEYHQFHRKIHMILVVAAV